MSNEISIRLSAYPTLDNFYGYRLPRSGVRAVFTTRKPQGSNWWRVGPCPLCLRNGHPVQGHCHVEIRWPDHGPNIFRDVCINMPVTVTRDWLSSGKRVYGWLTVPESPS